ncbi:MAG: cation:proton antiporter [Candidatus Reddybacter sp.]
MDNLSHLALIWSGVLIAGFLAGKTKLTPVLFFLAIGCLLVNVGLLPEGGTPFIKGFSEVGIILIMFALGFEESADNFLGSIKRSWGIAFFGGIVPFAIACSAAWYFWHNWNIAMLCGLTMTSTAVSLTMATLKSEGLQSSRPATGILTSAVLEDIASLVLVAVLIPIAAGDEALSALAIEIIVLKALGFFAIVSVIGIWVFPHDLSHSWFAKVPLLGRYGLRDLISYSKGEHATLVILLLATLVGILSHHFGLHPAVGAYMAGLVMKEEYFHFNHEEAATASTGQGDYQANKRIIDNVAFSWIGPVFFVDLGAKLIFDWDIFVDVIPETLMLTTGILVGQVISSALAARYTGGFTFEEAMLIGFGMLGRAELAFVVMDIAYVKQQIFTTEVFYTLMFTAFWLNVAVPISIKLWKPRFLAAQAKT